MTLSDMTELWPSDGAPMPLLLIAVDDDDAPAVAAMAACG